MRYRTYKNTELTVSEVGFGLWTISTGWWGNFTEGEAIALMHKALDLGVTLFDAADTYGNGLSEEQRKLATILSRMGRRADAASARFRRIFPRKQLAARQMPRSND